MNFNKSNSSNNQALEMVCLFHLPSNATTPNDSWTTVAGLTEVFTKTGWLPNGKFIAPSTGWYEISWRAMLEKHGDWDKRFLIQIRSNGNTLARAEVTQGGADIRPSCQFTKIIHCEAGDEVIFVTYQNKGGDMLMFADPYTYGYIKKINM